MLMTKYVDDNYKMLVMVLAILVTNILPFYISVGHKHSKDVSNIENVETSKISIRNFVNNIPKSSPTLSH